MTIGPLPHPTDAFDFEHSADHSRNRAALRVALDPFDEHLKQVRQRQSWALTRRSVSSDKSLLKSIRSSNSQLSINNNNAISLRNLIKSSGIEQRTMKKVEIYTWASCPFCIRAKSLLKSKGVKYIEYSIDGDQEARNFMALRSEGRTSVPQIFIDDISIGGCDDLHNLEQNQQLDNLLGLTN